MEVKKEKLQQWGREGGLKSNGGGQAFKNRELAREAGRKSGEVRRQRKLLEQSKNQV